MTQPQDGPKTKKIKMQSDALSNATAGNKVAKKIKSDQRESSDNTIASNVDDVDQLSANIVGNDIISSSTGCNTKSSIDDNGRRNSYPHQNGGPSNGGNSLISRDTLILLPEGGKNSATNSDKYPVTRSSRNSDNDNSDTDVSTIQIVHDILYT